MPTRTFSIYRVPNSYVSTGADPTITFIDSMTITDDDGNLEATEGADPGTSQTMTVNGVAVDSYQFFYDDNITINGNVETVKTFQVVIGGNTFSFMMNDDDDEIAGVSVGDTATLNTYAGYTAIDYDDLPCFVRGTRIKTTNGLKRIEDLKVGDLVHTLDRGPQPIRWIGSAKLSVRDLIARPHLRPVVIPAQSFGKELPIKDLHLSPQHRCLLRGWPVEMSFGLPEVLAPAKSMVGRRGIHIDHSCREVSYFHLMFDHHEVIFSEGLPTESFLVGDTIRDGMDQDQLNEILELFPDLAFDRTGRKNEPSRPILRSFEVSVLDELVS